MCVYMNIYINKIYFFKEIYGEIDRYEEAAMSQLSGSHTDKRIELIKWIAR